MTDTVATSGGLRKNSIGLSHIVFFVVAAAAPLTAVVGATPPAFAFGNGAGVAGAFILVGLVYMVFSVGFTAMSRHVGSAGAFYTYISHGIGKPAGVGGAFIALLTYNAIQIATYAAFGVFLGQALLPFGIALPWWMYAVAAVGIVMLCGRRKIGFSASLLGFCLVAEIAVLALLDIAILVNGGGKQGISLSSLSPRTVFAPGLGIALVFVVGSYMGFEATAIFAEEARDPERTIPHATYTALFLITGFYAFSTWAITQYYGPALVAQAARDHLSTLYFDAAAGLLGAWASNLMNILLITSLFACALSFHNTINRYLFALGREGLLWRRLGETDARSGSPAAAGVLQSAGALMIIGIFAVGGQDPYTVVFSWAAAIATMGILSVQVLVCIAIVAFFRRDPKGFSLWRRAIAPVAAGLGLTAAVGLVVINLPLLAGSESALVLSFPYLVALTGLSGAALALWLRVRRPTLYAALGRVFEA
jgi:amino acid transporter